MEKKLIRILKDRTFLLDVLMQHESASPVFESSDDDLTEHQMVNQKLSRRIQRESNESV
jgi:hypothetical protein